MVIVLMPRLQLPGMLAHSLFVLLHAAFVLAHVPLFEQSPGPVQATNGFFTHAPMTVGQSAVV